MSKNELAIRIIQGLSETARIELMHIGMRSLMKRGQSAGETAHNIRRAVQRLEGGDVTDTHWDEVAHQIDGRI